MQTFNDPSVSDDAAPSTYPLQAVAGVQDMQRILAGLSGTGVLYGCKVSLHSGGGGVDITAGRFSIDGNEYVLAAQTNVALTNAHASKSRVDQVVLTANVSTGAVTVTIANGTAATPYAVEATVSTNGYGLVSGVVLAAVYTVAAGGAVASATQIVDKRGLLRDRVLASGWACDSNAWSVTTAGAAGTAATGSTNATTDTACVFTTTGDFRARYRKGTKLRCFISGTAKYGVVASVAFASTTTTVTLLPTSLTAGLITTTPDTDAMFYSHEDSPEGFPDWFSWVPSYGGCSAYGSATCRWKAAGNQIHVRHVSGADFTSNATTKTVTAPVTALNGAANASGVAHFATKDNGTILTTPGYARIIQNTATIDLFKDQTAAAWTNSGNWRGDFFIIYEF